MTSRRAPAPTELVKLLPAHIRRYGTTLGGRVFQTAREDHPGLGLQRCVGAGPQEGPHRSAVPVYGLRHAAV